MSNEPLKHDRIVIEERITYRHDVYVIHNFSDEELEKKLAFIDDVCEGASLDRYVQVLKSNGFNIELVIPADQDSPYDHELEIAGVEEVSE